MSEIEVYISLDARDQRVGTLFRQSVRGKETVSFAYHDDWLGNPQRFSLEPALQVGIGLFHPNRERGIFGSIGDSAPDTWGRRLMQRAERRQAEIESRQPRTLLEVDYLLGVTDVSRLGHLDSSELIRTNFRSPQTKVCLDSFIWDGCWTAQNESSVIAKLMKTLI